MSANATIDLAAEPRRLIAFAATSEELIAAGGAILAAHLDRGDRVVCVIAVAEDAASERRAGEAFALLGGPEVRRLGLPAASERGRGGLGSVHDLVARLGAVLDSLLVRGDGIADEPCVLHVLAPPSAGAPGLATPAEEDARALCAALAAALADARRSGLALRVLAEPFAQRRFAVGEACTAKKHAALRALGSASAAASEEPCATMAADRWLDRLRAAARTPQGVRPLGTQETLPPVTAVVSTWNKRGDVLANLESLRGQTLPFAAVVVVDNASADGTAAAVAAAFPEVQVVAMPHSAYGACETFNIGFANARTPLLAILDDDIVMSPAWLERATRRKLAEPPTTAIVSTKVVEPGMPAAYAEAPELNRERYMSTFRGCASLADADALRRAGGYDERLFIYGNERDLTCRLLNLGYRVLQHPSAEVFHKTPFGIKLGKRSLYYHARNAWLTMLKYAPLGDLLRMPWLVLTKVLLRSRAEEESGKVHGATGTIGIGRAVRETPGALLVLARAAGSVLWNVPYCLRRRQPVRSGDFELPLE